MGAEDDLAFAAFFWAVVVVSVFVYLLPACTGKLII